MRNTRFSNRGVSLVEAMVALAVMAFGMLTVVGVQSTLRLNADISKQRSEATRIAQRTIEGDRAFVAIEPIPGERTWGTIAEDASPIAVPAAQSDTNTSFTVQRRVISYADPASKVLSVTVRWVDRSGTDQNVMLRSTIAGAAPALSGALAVRPTGGNTGPIRRPLRRHASIPTQARDFGTSSAFVPPFRPWIAIVFNNVTGVVTGVCTFNFNTSNDSITPDDVAACSNNTVGQLLSGFVRFLLTSSGPPLAASDVENPPGPALNLRMQLALTSSNHPNPPFCIDDANSFSVGPGLTFVTYYCVIYSNSSALWSGISTIEPRSLSNGDLWQISEDTSAPAPGAELGRYRVCRYTTAASDTQVVLNEGHPRNYADVAGNLTNQNFVVISSSKTCPTETPSAGDLVNTNTLQHQPAPS